ncbi:unnamed protein product [Staurois parvus]|uniref:Uncharacterized protein n=1 Tax=Staurois parvus TaxID=386267 RepID=A0ABN9BQL8_9NEOB|nr:unnamed protein product [Staurois parvus]
MYIHRNTHAQTHRHMYIHTQTHVHTNTCTYMHIHTDTDTCTHTHTHVHTHTCTYTQTHVHTDTHTNTHTHTCTHTPPIKSCSTSLFTHRAGYCTLGGGREQSTHSFLCFHCAQLLSSLTAPSANDRSGLSSEPAQQDSPGGHTRPPP